MEATPHIDPEESLAAQPNYIAEYGRMVITAYGMTGELEKLANICPVDLNDPSISLQTKNEVTIKLLNESGAEIAPEHENDFAHVLEESGLKRNFTVAASEQTERNKNALDKSTSGQSQQEAAPKPPKPAADKNTLTTPKLREEGSLSEQAATTASQQASTPVKRVIKPEHSDVEAAIRLKTELLQKNLGSMSVAARLPPGPPGHKGPLKREKAVKNRVASLRKQIKANTPATTKQVGPTIKTRPKREVSQVSPGHRTQANEQHDGRPKRKPHSEITKNVRSGAAKIKKTNKENYLRKSETVPVLPEESVIETETEIHEIALTANLLYDPVELPYKAAEQEPVTEQESLEFFDGFAEELQALIVAETVWTDDSGEEPDLAAAEQSANKSEVNILQAESMPAIVLAVVEQLERLEPDQKAAVELTLQKIVEASLPVTMLETDATRPEAEQVAVEQLKEQVAVLFEQLDIDYEPEDLDQFVKIVLRLNRQPAAPAPVPELPEEAAADLEHDGTREAKWRLSRLAGGLFGTEYAAEELLGKLALRFARGQRSDPPAWSYLGN